VRRLLPALFVLLIVLTVAPSAQAAPTMSIHDPITDNYKASYNADPSVQERRTWLSWVHLVAGGTTWLPAARDTIGIGDVQLVAADGRTGSLHIAAVSGTEQAIEWRVDALSADSGGRWGPLVTTWERQGSQPSVPLLFDLSIKVDGALFARGRVAYRWDSALANAPAGNLEYNGPGGRWTVGATRTRTDQEAAPATPPTMLAAFPPRLTSLRVPIRTSARTITIRLTTARGSAPVTRARISIAGRAFSRWVVLRSSYRVTLPAGTAYRSVRVQVRDSLGLASGIATRRVRCVC
jgi:hypothetical protein